MADQAPEQGQGSTTTQPTTASKQTSLAWFRPILALIMVATATLGAAVAFRSAQGDDSLSELDLRLNTGRMFEIARWVEYASQYATAATLGASSQDHLEHAQRLAAQADELRATDLLGARERDLRAEEEFALARIPGQFSYFLKSPGGDDRPIAEHLAADVTDALGVLGFGDEPPGSSDEAPTASAPQGEAVPPALIGQVLVWRSIERERAGIESRVPRLSGTVVLFIFALVLFTFSDLATRRYWLDVQLALAGFAMVVTAVGLTLLVDRASWPLILAICLFFTAFTGYAWWHGRFRATSELKAKQDGGSETGPREPAHPTEPEARSYGGAHLFLRSAEHTGSQLSVILIALTVLASTGVGYLYSDASINSQQLIHKAERYQVALVERSSQASATIAAGFLEPAVDIWSARMRCAAATQRRDLDLVHLGAGAALGEDRDASILDARDACDVLENGRNPEWSEMLDQRGIDGEREAVRVAYTDVLSGMGEGPSRLYALIDGYDQLSADWRGKATIYLASLTLMAIAVYMFGQALAMGSDWEGKTFVRFGVVFVAVGSLWAGAAWSGLDTRAESLWRKATGGAPELAVPPSCGTLPSSDEARIAYAANHYQQGEVALSLAPYLDGADASKSYADAVDELNCAVAARPLFGMAQIYRDRAYTKMNSPQATGGYASLPTKGKIHEAMTARAWAARAFEREGLHPPEQTRAEGMIWNHILLALLDGDRRELDAAIKALASMDAADTKSGAGCNSLSAIPMSGRYADSHGVETLNFGFARLIEGRIADAEAKYRCAIDHYGVARDSELIFAAMTDFNILHAYCRNLKPSTPAKCEALWQETRKIASALLSGHWPSPPPASKPAMSDVRIWATASEVGWRARLNPELSAGGDDRLTVVWYRLEAVSDAADDQWNVWHALPDLSRVLKISELKRRDDGSVELVTPYFETENACLSEGQYFPEFYVNGVPVDGLNLKPVALGAFYTQRLRAMNLEFCRPSWWHSDSTWNPELTKSFSDENHRLLAAFWTVYAPVDVDRSALVEASLPRLLRAIAPLVNRSFDDLRAHVSELPSCDASISGEAIFYRAWTTSEGFLHIGLLTGPAVGKDDCWAVLSAKNYWTPQPRTAAAESTQKPTRQ